MIGGLMKTTSRLTIATAFAAFAATGAMAADLGGNCCADLEERVAELEATTARKGNRRVSLEVSGHVHEAIVFWNVDTSNGVNEEANTYIGTHNSSRSRFRFKGSARIDSDWSAGFLMEFGVRANHLGSNSQTSPYNVSGLDIRHEALYLKSKRLGTVWMGWTSSAADGITEICLGCTLGGSPDYSDDMGNLLAGNGARFDQFGGPHGAFLGEGDRREVIRYISPEFAGFVFSSAYGQDDFYDVALRYANEFNGVRVAAGVGYQHDTTGDSGPGFISSAACQDGDGLSTYECDLIGASASVQHVASGVYVHGAYGYAENQLAAFPTDESHAWSIAGGVNRKFSPLGASNFWGKYTRAENDFQNTELAIWAIGFQQNIDAAATELYIHYKHFEADDNNLNAAQGNNSDMDQVVVGARIKF